MSDHDSDLKYLWKPGKNGHGILSAKMNGDRHPLLTRKLDSTDPRQQKEFIDQLVKKCPGIPRDLAEDKMEEVAALCLGGENVEQEKIGVAQLVARLADGAKLFRCGDTPYVTVEVADPDGDYHPETYSIGSLQFQRWLEARFYRTYGRPATSAAISDATNALGGRAIHDGREISVAVRIAEFGDAIYLDLCDDAWRVVRITDGGWSIVKDPPVKFLRKKGMMPLPTPVRGGNINQLRPLLNIGEGEQDQKNFVLMVSWLLAALHPRGPYPILMVNGEPGSAKSTATKMLRMLVDPNKTMLRGLPREERDLMIQANNGWVLAFDNISGMRRWISDCLCRLSTGGGFGTRMLHTDDTEILLDAKRPMILNGIEEDATKEDLLERHLPVILPAIHPKARLPEAKIWRNFEQAAPQILGALLDAVAHALANVRAIQLEESPRMADFAVWIVAAEEKLGWEKGTFMNVYHGSREDTDDAVMEQSAVGNVVLSFMANQADGVWSGTVKELLTALNGHADEQAKEHEDWPEGVQQLGAALRRLAPVLRRKGVDYAAAESKKKGRRTMTLTRTPEYSADLVHLGTLSTEMPF